MPPLKRQRAHMKRLANKRRCDARDGPTPDQGQLEASDLESGDHENLEPLWDAHWEGLTEDEDSGSEDEANGLDVPLDSIIDDLDASERNNGNAFEQLAGQNDWSRIKGPVFSSGSRQQGPVISERTDRRKRAAALDLKKEAQTIQPLSKWFGPSAVQAEPQPSMEEKRAVALKDLKQLLRRKSHGLRGETHRRHELVLQLMHATRSRLEHETRKDIAFNIARGHGRGKYLSAMVLKWERQWINTRKIDDDERGRKNALRSWLNDEGTMLAVREYIAQAGTSKIWCDGYTHAVAVLTKDCHRDNWPWAGPSSR